MALGNIRVSLLLFFKGFGYEPELFYIFQIGLNIRPGWADNVNVYG